MKHIYLILGIYLLISSCTKEENDINNLKVSISMPEEEMTTVFISMKTDKKDSRNKSLVYKEAYVPVYFKENGIQKVKYSSSFDGSINKDDTLFFYIDGGDVESNVISKINIDDQQFSYKAVHSQIWIKIVYDKAWEQIEYKSNDIVKK